MSRSQVVPGAWAFVDDEGLAVGDPDQRNGCSSLALVAVVAAEEAFAVVVAAAAAAVEEGEGEAVPSDASVVEEPIPVVAVENDVEEVVLGIAASTMGVADNFVAAQLGLDLKKPPLHAAAAFPHVDTESQAVLAGAAADGLHYHCIGELVKKAVAVAAAVADEENILSIGKRTEYKQIPKRKFQNGNRSLYKSDFECVNEKDSPEADISLIKVIGAANVKRWNALKTALNCETNFEFTTKLLDITQQFLNKGNVEVNVSQKNVNEEGKKKYKNKTVHDDWIFQLDKNDENDDAKNSVKTNERQSEKLNDDRSSNLASVSNDQEVAPDNESCENGHLMVKNSVKLNGSENEIKTEKPEENVQEKPISLDVIKIRLCHYCNTHHIQDHCPINLPQYNIFDNVAFDVWKQNYKPLFENFWSNVKKKAKKVIGRKAKN
ncbi:unnamed protein product [Acanthoscelides obtectus]|uniref:Uncharacterized protein n=1 Tax=Acanthoscelides obtectus TaxID=200917 RepID=A0A9P0M5S1_ACAOB|nr:unnamed protein product [Acanthoscelides obtectus]CAK1636221.1 hypothetical protein AOBTE_LOCUS9784 [Acanthoscelides obtectus]